MFELSKKDKAHAASDRLVQQDRDHRTGGETDSAASHSQAQSGEIAVIGRSIRIEGNVRGEEDLRVEGDISGTIRLPNHSLTIGTEGRIKADAYAKSVTVDGEVNGDLYASECVNIRSNARVKGNIVASLVNLEQGARFKGSIDMDPEKVEAALGKESGAQASASDADRPNGSKQATAAVVNPTPGKPLAVQRISGDK